VDIGGGFGVKYVVTSLLLLWAVILIVNYGVHIAFTTELAVLLFFSSSVCYAVSLGLDPANIYSQTSFLIYFALLVLLIRIPRGVSTTIFYKVLVVGSLMIIGTLLMMKLAPSSRVIWNQIGEEYRLGYFGSRLISGIDFPVVYYRWSMWLIPAFIFTFDTHKKINAVIGIAALITLSTSVIMFSLLGTLLLFTNTHTRPTLTHKNLICIAVTCISFVLIVCFFYEQTGIFWENTVSKLSIYSESSAIKLGHIESALKSTTASFTNLILGTGAGSEFYSLGTNDYVINIEPSHFNFLRQFGLIGVLVFFSYIANVTVSVYRTDANGKRLSIGLLMLFVSAGTNPILMSPQFITVLMIARAYKIRFRVESIHDK
jgi:hypothetical protein